MRKSMLSFYPGHEGNDVIVTNIIFPQFKYMIFIFHSFNIIFDDTFLNLV